MFFWLNSLNVPFISVTLGENCPTTLIGCDSFSDCFCSTYLTLWCTLGVEEVYLPALYAKAGLCKVTFLAQVRTVQAYVYICHYLPLNFFHEREKGSASWKIFEIRV